MFLSLEYTWLGALEDTLEAPDNPEALEVKILLRGDHNSGGPADSSGLYVTARCHEASIFGFDFRPQECRVGSSYLVRAAFLP